MDVSRYADLFLTESKEHLSAMNALLLTLEREPSAAEPVAGIFRAVSHRRAHPLHRVHGAEEPRHRRGGRRLALEREEERVHRGEMFLALRE